MKRANMPYQLIEPPWYVTRMPSGVGGGVS